MRGGARWRNVSGATVVASFLGLLAFPIVAYGLGYARGNADYIRATEDRNPAVFPPTSELLSSTPRFTRGVEDVVADHFPLRRWLIGGYNAGIFFILGGIKNPAVIHGRGEWFFVNVADTGPPGSPSFPNIRCIVNRFVTRSEWSAARKAHYVLVLVPDKNEIYPEQLPPNRMLEHPTVRKLILPLLRAAKVDTVDPTGPLTLAKRGGAVFFRSDSHWNDRGAYATYRALVGDLRLPDMVARLSPEETASDFIGDLPRLAGLVDFVKTRESFFKFKSKVKWEARGTNPDVRVSRLNNARLPTAVIMSDSFGNALRPMLAENFRRATFIARSGNWQFDGGFVSTQRPEYVIQILVDATLRGGFQYLTSQEKCSSEIMSSPLSSAQL